MDLKGRDVINSIKNVHGEDVFKGAVMKSLQSEIELETNSLNKNMSEFMRVVYKNKNTKKRDLYRGQDLSDASVFKYKDAISKKLCSTAHHLCLHRQISPLPNDSSNLVPTTMEFCSK